MFLALFLLAIPLANEKYNKLTRVARALKEDRTNFVLVGTGTAITFLISYVVSNTPNSQVLNLAKVYHHNFGLDRAWLQGRKERSQR